MASLPDRFRKQYGEAGIYAGASHFRDYWSRDNCFAAFGALALKDYAIVRASLDTFLGHLEGGHVPIRVGAINQMKRFLKMNPGYGAVHAQDKGKNPSMDGNSLVLILAEKYEQLSLKKLDAAKLRAVHEWIDSQERDQLIPEGPFSSWEDSLNLSGPRLYTNVLHYRALLAASKLFRDPSYAARAIQTKLQLRAWWNGTYFTDGPKRDVFMTAGNLLAVIWGIADPKQARSILAHLAKRDTVCPPAGLFSITRAEGYRPFFLINMADYHARQVEWSWLAALEIAAYRSIGDDTEADKRHHALTELFARSGAVFEVYERDKPLKRLFYKSERNFAWTLGVLIASQPSSLSILR